MAVWLQVKVRGRDLRLWPIGSTSALSVTQKRPCSCGMRFVALYKCYMPMHFPFPMSYRRLSTCNAWTMLLPWIGPNCDTAPQSQSRTIRRVTDGTD